MASDKSALHNTMLMLHCSACSSHTILRLEDADAQPSCKAPHHIQKVTFCQSQQNHIIYKKQGCDRVVQITDNENIP